MRRGEIRWYTFAAPDKRRPVLALTRDAVIDSISEIIVAPITRTLRGIKTEVVLTPEDGMPVACAVNLDHVSLACRERLGPVITKLADARWPEVERALLVACGFRPERKCAEMTDGVPNGIRTVTEAGIRREGPAVRGASGAGGLGRSRALGRAGTLGGLGAPPMPSRRRPARPWLSPRLGGRWPDVAALAHDLDARQRARADTVDLAAERSLRGGGR